MSTWSDSAQSVPNFTRQLTAFLFNKIKHSSDAGWIMFALRDGSHHLAGRVTHRVDQEGERCVDSLLLRHVPITTLPMPTARGSTPFKPNSRRDLGHELGHA